MVKKRNTKLEKIGTNIKTVSNQKQSEKKYLNKESAKDKTHSSGLI